MTVVEKLEATDRSPLFVSLRRTTLLNRRRVTPMVKDGPDVADVIDVFEEDRKGKSPQRRAPNSIGMERKAFRALLDELDDTIDFSGKGRTKPGRTCSYQVRAPTASASAMR